MRHTFFVMPSYNDIINNAIELNMPNSGVYDKQQRREFGQQAALQLQAQDFATDYAGKMRKMKEAGINPMLAAGGLAGAQSPSISSVPSTAVGQGANIAQTVSDAVQTALGGAKDIVDSISTAKKIDPEIKNLNADTNKKLAEYGLTNEQIYSWQVDNKYKDANAQVELRTKLLTEKNTAKEWEVMHAQYELMTTQLDTEIAKQKDLYEHAKLNASQVGLADAQKAYYDALQRKTDYEAQWSGIRIEWWNKQGYDLLNSSSDAIMVQRLENGLDNQDIIKEWSNYYGSVEDKKFEVQDKYAYSIAYRRKHGENVADVVDNRIGGWSDLIGRLAEHMDFHLGNIFSAVKSVPRNRKGAVIRNELTLVLNNCYKTLENYPDDKDVAKIAEDLQFALSLTNEELVSWYSKNWK